MAELIALPPAEIDGHAPSSVGNDDHPMRRMTRRAAGLAGPPWDAAAAAEVQGLFDLLAPDWHTRSSPERTAVVTDALDRGLGTSPSGTAVEVGSGIGAYSRLLAGRSDRVISVELSPEMLRRAPADASHRIRGDASALPLPDGVADVVVLVNMFLFPSEVDRVRAPGGRVVWVNSSGENTPIHLAPAEVLSALPGEWDGCTSRAGAGLWAVVHRAG